MAQNVQVIKSKQIPCDKLIMSLMHLGFCLFALDLVSLIFDDLHQDSPEVIGAVLNTFFKNVT